MELAGRTIGFSGNFPERSRNKAGEILENFRKVLGYKLGINTILYHFSLL